MKVFLAGGSGAIGKPLIPLLSLRQLETMVVTARNLEGVALRYGAFYGPGTQIGPGGQLVKMCVKHMFPNRTVSGGRRSPSAVARSLSYDRRFSGLIQSASLPSMRL